MASVLYINERAKKVEPQINIPVHKYVGRYSESLNRTGAMIELDPSNPTNHRKATETYGHNVQSSGTRLRVITRVSNEVA